MDVCKIKQVLKMFGNIPDENDRLKRKASWLNIYLFKRSRTLVAILTIWSNCFMNIKGKNDVELVGVIKNE